MRIRLQKGRRNVSKEMGHLHIVLSRDITSSELSIDNERDGLLKGWEIVSLGPLHAQIFVLSGCSTGTSNNSKSESVAGLARAVQMAGVRYVVASLWDIADRETSGEMIKFHKQILLGKPYDKALRDATYPIGSEIYSKHPHFWAPFVLIGD